MNKPATKEPSMDEILSSIRQIIADDDAGAPRKPAIAAVARAPVEDVPPMIEPEPEPEALALTADQMLTDMAGPAANDLSFDEILGTAQPDRPLTLVDPDDITFDSDDDRDPLVAMMDEPPMAAAQPSVRPMPRPAVSVSRAAPLPDPDLTADIAEQLVEPATQMAVKSTFAKLSNLSTVGTGDLTIEQMLREMLRPMLKEWLDENLPSLVERLVEQEIARVSRGGR